MASEKLFENIPPFPDDIPIASITRISLTGLRSGDEVIAQSLLEACQTLGFFLLDLRGDMTGDTLVAEIDELMGNVNHDIMGLPLDVKKQYHVDVPRSFEGFKIRGVGKTETNEPDRFEWFNIGQDGLTGVGPLPPLPPIVQNHLPLFTSYLKHSQEIASIIHTTLAIQLGLPADTFASLSRPTESSLSLIRLLKFEGSSEARDLRTAMRHHTDIGIVTLLANVLGGLQVLEPGKPVTDPNAWLWVRPQPRTLIVNLGDAMVQWTGGLLRSNAHRVTFSPGDQRSMDRYSMAYFLRPERNVSMRRLIGQGDDGDVANMTAAEWEARKTMAFKQDGDDDIIVNRHKEKGARLDVMS
ncbi:oxidoreductase [Fusarium albosuccineum]|uniref:Oxidoreductase n=1 Tax=Fusarium albosuccineum TaxID=1237068 RepID=A0A8H4LP09_9HYPO|nr:oxidoreductase [Fusarium albosuccineum]